MPLATTYRRRLYERALDQYGYVTTRDAADLGVPRVELRKLALRGGLERIGHGVYRFDEIPPTERGQFMEAVLQVGPGAHLVGDAVLALHNLGLVNPRKIRVAAPRQVRRRLPATIQVERRALPPEATTEYEGIPAETVAQALIDSRGQVMRERLVEAAQQALEAGLIPKAEGRRVLAELGEAT